MSVLAPILLAPLSVLYGAITRARLLLYRRRLLSLSQLAAPVISVGNLTTGGTGKTPLVEFIARALALRGRSVCVLTRGYGREKARQRVVVSDGHKVLASETEAGDEPRLLAENLIGIAAVISDANRFTAGAWAMANLGSQVFVLDDGFQHQRLVRDLNIVAVDATNPWGHGHLLPWGRLREPTQQLSRADCVVITRADQVASLGELRQDIEEVAPNKPVFTSRMILRGLRRIEDRPSAKRQVLADKDLELPQPVAAFCAVGNPTSFIAQLKNAGYEPVTTILFRDHHRYSSKDVHEIVTRATAAGARSLITTAKDAVKLRAFAIALPCYVLEIEISIDSESAFLEIVYSSLASEL